MHAVVVRAVPSGFILCLPPGAINEEELDQATADGYVGELGPWTVSNVTATSVHGRELKRVLPCLLIDFAASAFSYLSMNAPSAGSSGDILTFGVVRLQSVWPSRLNLLVALEAFLNGDELDERLDAYFTGEENLDPPLPLPATFDIGSTGVGEAEVGTDGAEQARATQHLLHQLLTLKPACSRRCRRSWSKSAVWSPGLLSWRFRRQAQGLPPECFQPLWKEPLRGPLSCLAKELKPSWIRSRSSNSLFWRAGARKIWATSVQRAPPFSRKRMQAS